MTTTTIKLVDVQAAVQTAANANAVKWAVLMEITHDFKGIQTGGPA